MGTHEKQAQALSAPSIVHGPLLDNSTDIEWLKKTCDTLFQLLDDIDTAGDIAKSDDRLYRAIVERLQARRWETGITTDGYHLYAPLAKDNRNG